MCSGLGGHHNSVHVGQSGNADESTSEKLTVNTISNGLVFNRMPFLILSRAVEL